VRWWRYAFGAGLLLWVLGIAYRQARRRNRELGIAVLLAGGAFFLFATAALVPRPPMTATAASVCIIASVICLAVGIGIVLWKGFSD